MDDVYKWASGVAGLESRYDTGHIARSALGENIMKWKHSGRLETIVQIIIFIAFLILAAMGNPPSE